MLLQFINSCVIAGLQIKWSQEFTKVTFNNIVLSFCFFGFRNLLQCIFSHKLTSVTLPALVIIYLSRYYLLFYSFNSGRLVEDCIYCIFDKSPIQSDWSSKHRAMLGREEMWFRMRWGWELGALPLLHHTELPDLHRRTNEKPVNNSHAATVISSLRVSSLSQSHTHTHARLSCWADKDLP